MKLKDKIAIVTGAGRGLGRSIALTFAREGAKVVLAARNREEIDHLAGQLRALRKEAIAVPSDVTDEEQVNRLVEKTLETFGTVNILVNNASARGPIGPLHLVPLLEWEKALRFNLTSAFLCSKAVLPAMMEKKMGRSSISPPP